MTKATVKKAGAQRKAAIRLSDPATVERVFKLNRDEPFDSGDYLCIGDLVNDLLSYTDTDTFSREVFMFAFPKAAGRVEKRSGKVAPAGAKAYRELRRVLARLDAGETLVEIEQKERARYEAMQEGRAREELNAPEPKDRTSRDWRLWTLRHIEAGMNGEDEAARVEAWGAFWSFFDDFKNRLLRRREYTAEDASEASELLPDLIINWQRAQPSRGKEKAEVNHETVARALAAVLHAQPEGKAAQAIVNAADRLGAAISQPEIYDLRPVFMLRRLLDAHTTCAYDLDGQDGRKGKRAYDKLVTLAGK
jgi:hypothetical protein